MKLKTCCFTINSYNQAVEIIKISEKNKIMPILFIKYYLVNRFGIDWLKELIIVLQDQFGSKDFKTYVESKKNYGLFISLVEQKIDYISVQADQESLKRLKQIAKLNKVLINPTFSVVDLSKSKNINAKLRKLYN